MSYQQIRIEALADIFQELGIVATVDQIEKAANDFYQHIEMESEQQAYQHVGRKEECPKCKLLESQLKEVTEEKNVYQNSVKRRRNAERVWVSGNEVRYE